MIEVFKITVKDRGYANMLTDQVRNPLIYCTANFDLVDCDNILRVESTTRSRRSSFVINQFEGFWI